MAEQQKPPAAPSPELTQKAEPPAEQLVQRARDTVTVGCKHPSGLLLRLFKMVPATEPVMGGGVREFKKAEQVPGMVRLNGFRVPQEAINAGEMPHPVVAGVGLTHNVDKEFMQEWFAQNAESPLVREGLVFFHDQGTSVAAWAKERVAERSTLEPIDPDKPGPRIGDRRVQRGDRAELTAA